MAKPISQIESHPQRQQIIDALMAGTKLRIIAAQCDPPVTMMAISRFRNRAITQTANALSTANKALALQCQSTPSDQVDSVNRAALATAIDPFVSAALRSSARRERWMEDLEMQPDLDSYKVLATLDKNDLAAQEYHARLANRLGGQEGHQTNNLHLYLNIPRHDPASIQPAIDTKKTGE